MSEIKTIQVNKDFLSSTKQNKKIKTKKPSTKTLSSPNKMRKEFLKKLKNFQSKRNSSLKTREVVEKTSDEKEFEQEFNKSLLFLQKFKSKKEENIVKIPPCKDDVEISVILPKSLETPIIQTKKPSINNELAASNTNSTQMYKKPIKLLPRPSYSSLKNSTKPTYREWIKTQKVKSGNKPTHVIINDKPTTECINRPSVSLNTVKTQKNKIKRKRITKTIKHLLGKTGNRVGILIKNRQTRRKIQIEQAKLNKTSIHSIKKYLRDRNLIKVGSNSPNDVLRKLYEQCVLAGDITNNSENILLHNFINDKKPE